jgi:CRP-like cAMP-binding protein
MSPRAYSPNLLISALLPDDMALVEPHFTRVEMHRGQVLVAPGQPIEQVWFPEGGVASVVATTVDQGKTEVGIFGFEGFSGIPLVLGTDRSPYETFIQVDDHTALCIEASRFSALIEQSSTLRTLLSRYVHTFVVQTAQSAMSNAQQRIEARLARWLLMCHDRTDGDPCISWKAVE